MRIIFPHLTYVILSAHTLNFWIYRYEIKHPDIVYAQAMLESMWMSCEDCSLDKCNNVFGFSVAEGTYIKFNHWTESVQFYSRWQKGYSGATRGEYYKYLEDHWGAPNMKAYIKKLKSVVRIVNESK